MATRKFLYMDQTEGFATEQSTADDLSLGKIVFTGVGGVAIDAGGFTIANVGAPSSGSDAANKTYVDNKINGVNWKPSVRAMSSSNTTVSNPGTAVFDGVTLSSGDRLLLTGQSTASQNGIWVFNGSGSALTRPVDYGAASTQTPDTAVFVAEGTSNSDTGWVISSDGSVTVDTTATTWTQFTGLGSITAGNGLSKTGTTISVKQGDGIELTSNSNAVNLALTANAGLQLTGSSPTKTLGILVDPNGGLQVAAAGESIKLATNSGLSTTSSGAAIALQSNPGLQLGASGLAFLPDPNGGLQNGASGASVKAATANTLTTSSSGLDVTGVPSLFKINGVATSANVTSANLGTLTAGSGSDASSLHTHTSVSAAGAVQKTYTADGTGISAGRAVYYSANNTISQAANTANASSDIIGIAPSSISASGTGTVVRLGIAAAVISSASAGTPYYLGPTGIPIVFSSIASGARVIRLGFAANATDLDVQIQDLGKKA
jgi:hypothetical protein